MIGMNGNTAVESRFAPGEINLFRNSEADELLITLSRAVEQSASSIVITAADGTIEYANGRFCEVSGYGLEEIIGLNPLINSDQQQPEIFVDAWDVVSRGREWRGDRQTRQKNGGLVWESVAISPIRNGVDEISHYLVVGEDITERKKAEYELRKNKAELLVKHEQLNSLFRQVEKAKKEWESTLDCIGDIVIVTDTECGIRRCNRALQELAGMPLKTISGRKWHEVLAASGLAIPDPCRQGTELHHGPSRRWFVVNTYPFTDSPGGDVSGAVITLHDTTEKKRFTADLEKAYSDLKATQAKIVQQEKMASIGQLAAGVAHEINNPMGFISSNLGTMGKYMERLGDYIRILLEAIDKVPDKELVGELKNRGKAVKLDYILEDGKDLIKESLDGAERVRTIVQNLKNFSRVDEAECKRADINDCITSTINIAWNELKYKVSLVKELGDIPLTRCHPQQINQVFMNLLVNAAQAIEEHGEITVRSWHDDDSIYAAVSDTGCGMSPEVCNRIFEPFFTTKEVGKGTGLGLSITYDIIKKHKGEITVESELGKGTTFTVRLPVVKE